MKKTVSTLLVIALVLSLCVPVAFASETTVNVLFDAEKNIISAFGKAEGAVMVTIVPFGEEIADMSEENMPVYIGQFTADGDYRFDIKILYDVPSGKYDIYVSSADGVAKDSFMYFDIDTANGVIAEMNKKSSIEEYKTAADKTELGIDETDEKYIKNEDKIFGALYKAKPDDIVSFSECYNKIYVLSAIEGAQKDEILMLLEKFSYVLGIDYNEFIKDDARLNDKITEEFTKLLSKINYIDEYDKNGKINVAEILENNKVLAAVRSAESWTELKQAVSVDFAEFFEEMLSYKKYKSVSNKNKVYQEMMDVNFDSIEKIEKEFQDICDSVYKKEKGTSSSGGSASSSGGGISSGGGVSVSAPVTKPDTDIVPGDNTSSSSDVFTDLPATNWCFEAVNALKKEGIISGYEDGSFKPSKSVTRAEFIKMIVSDLEDNSENVSSFGDVSESDWYYSFLMKARRLGIAEGSNNMFRPNDNISRQDATLILYRVLKLKGNEPQGFRPFEDWEDISDYASEAVLAMGCAGFVNGNSDNMFLPLNALTRAEAAQMIYNISDVH